MSTAEEAEIERLAKALEQIAYMDDFLNGETAARMMNIARQALNTADRFAADVVPMKE